MYVNKIDQALSNGVYMVVENDKEIKVFCLNKYVFNVRKNERRMNDRVHINKYISDHSDEFYRIKRNMIGDSSKVVFIQKEALAGTNVKVSRYGNTEKIRVEIEDSLYNLTIWRGFEDNIDEVLFKNANVDEETADNIRLRIELERCTNL